MRYPTKKARDEGGRRRYDISQEVECGKGLCIIDIEDHCVRVLGEAEVAKYFSAFPAKTVDYVQCEEHALFFAHPEANCIDLIILPSWKDCRSSLDFLARSASTIRTSQERCSGSRNGAYGTHLMRPLGIALLKQYIGLPGSLHSLRSLPAISSVRTN